MNCPWLIPTWTEEAFNAYMLDIARSWAKRTTCGKKAVGCVLVDRKGKNIGVGYNRSDLKCDCSGEPSGSGTCKATHAELVALLNCKDRDAIHTCYLTLSPCYHCTKALLETSCVQIVFKDHCEDYNAECIWKEAKREWINV